MKLASRLLLFDYLTSQIGGAPAELRAVARAVEHGRRPDGQSNYLSMFESWGARVQIERSLLAEYDMNVLGLEDQLGRFRAGFRFTYFQYLAALYTEIYLHRLADDPAGLLNDLRDYRKNHVSRQVSPVTKSDLRKAAFWMATGSGKTLLAHANLQQFKRYRPFKPENVLFVVPSPTLAAQHLEELAKSGLRARHALVSGRADDVQVLEITKLYVDRRDSEAPRGGESLPTSEFSGQNLLLVDEGHKGSTSAADRAEERKWRDIRQSLAGDLGFTFEYSATFAQITEANDELLDEYGKTILFDYGYRHFWEDGYGKDYRVINLRTPGAFDQDELLLAGLLALYEQSRVRADHLSEIGAYNIEPPLMVFIGATVTGQVESEVLQVVRFLDRVLTQPQWARLKIEALLCGSSSLPADLLSYRYPYLARLDLPGTAIYDDMCRRLFHGSGRLTLHMIQRGEGEIGVRTADAARDAYCGVINVGNAPGLFKNAIEAGIAAGEDDHVTESVFAAIDRPDSTVNFLVGAKKFIEGWSSWRVSVMGLLKVGRSAGPQVIQLFGRGVRLKGKDYQLRRSSHLLGSHPQDLDVVERLHIFGLKADYMETFNETIRREGVPPPVTRILPIKVRDSLYELDLKVPDHGDYNFFEQEVVPFSPSAIPRPIDINLVPTFATAEGIARHVRTVGADIVDTTAFPVDLADKESLFLELLDYKRRRGWYNVYITRSSVNEFLRTKVRVTAPKTLFHSADERARQFAQSVGTDALHKGLERFVYTQQRQHEMEQLQARSVDAIHENFPRVRIDGADTPAYRIEVPEDLVKEVDALIAKLRSNRAALEDMAEPLPRLHLDAHLYNPLLAKESDVGPRGQQLGLFHAVAVRSVPGGLIESEVQFVRDLRSYWAEVNAERDWQGYDLYLLRNLPRRGVGFFQTAGFYPDFLLWLTKGEHQALAFVEPHGMVMWDPVKVELLSQIRELGLEMPTIAYIVTETHPKSIGAVGGIPTSEEGLRGRHILLQTNPDYIQEIVTELRRAVDAVASGEYRKGDVFGEAKTPSLTIVDTADVPEDLRYTEYLPVYSLRAAAGYFGSGEAVDLLGWVQVTGRVARSMFVAKAVGRSMEPRIHDGDLCLFQRYQGGTRQNKIVLAQWAGPEDLETGGSYAVKQYRRVGERGSEGVRIELRPLNPEFEPIVLNPRYEDDVQVIAEFRQVLRAPGKT